MAYYVADNFRGSGNIFGSPPLYKSSAIAAANWQGFGGAPHTLSRQSTGGQLATASTAGSGTSALKGVEVFSTGGEPIGIGLTFEISAYGPFGIPDGLARDSGVYFVDGGWAYVSINGAGVVRFDYQTSDAAGFGTVTYSTGISRPVGTLTVLRVELSSSGSKVYVNNSLVISQPGAWQSTEAVAGCTIGYQVGSAPDKIPVSTTNVLLNYINVQVGVGSGPLGMPGAITGAVVLPKITLSAGMFAIGRGALHLPALYLPAPPTPPSFWTKTVGTREVP